MRLAALSLALALMAGDVLAETLASSNVAFPLPNTNQLFPARSNRLSLKCANPVTNGNVTVTYASGFVFVIAPGGALWETSRVPSGKITATGTAGQILSCEELYQ
jgi:hypothetical protein